MSDALDTVSARVKIQNVRGLHARASAKFCTLAERFDADIKVTKGELTVGGCSLMALLTLGAEIGSEVKIDAAGTDAQEAIDALVALVNDRFGEEK